MRTSQPSCNHPPNCPRFKTKMHQMHAVNINKMFLLPLYDSRPSSGRLRCERDHLQTQSPPDCISQDTSTTAHSDLQRGLAASAPATNQRLRLDMTRKYCVNFCVFPENLCFLFVLTALTANRRLRLKITRKYCVNHCVIPEFCVFCFVLTARRFKKHGKIVFFLN